jgi:hypothetical protein
MVNDSVVAKSGTYYRRIPTRSEFIPDRVIRKARKTGTYESFDSLICEIGGHSAWNRYEVEYDSVGRPTAARHFKAFRLPEVPGGPATEPDYFLSETASFEYDGSVVTQRTSLMNRGLTETLQRAVSTDGRILWEKRQSWDEPEYTILYHYR